MAIIPIASCKEGHTCQQCGPQRHTFPAQREGEQHAAVRFNDHERVKVLLDGEDISREAIEAIGGPEGIVRAYVRHESGALHRCSCGGGACEIELAGEVRIVREDE